MDRIFAFALSLLIAFAPEAALASQNNLYSPSTGTVSGLQLTNSFNNALDSLNTANSAATAPTNQLSGAASLGNFWLNTTAAPYPLGMNDGSSNWPAIGSLDPTNHYWDLQVGGGVANVASASTVNLCASPVYFQTITGTTTITSFGSSCPAGTEKVVQFGGVLTLTYNATSLIIPSSNNVITSAGDIARLLSLGGGNWQVSQYSPASGQALINPAVDLGDYLFTAAVTPPSSKYLLAYGQAISRTTYAGLLAVTTITQSVTRTSGSPTLTGFSDTTQIPGNAPIEGSGIPTADTIVSCASTTCTMAANATSSGTANVQIFPNGNGDRATTFNLPNCQGVTLAGRDNMSGTPRGILTAATFGSSQSVAPGANPDALGATGGGQYFQIQAGNLPSFTAPVGGGGCGTPTPGTYNPSVFPGTNGQAAITSPLSNVAVTVTNDGTASFTSTDTSMPIVQPTITANCMMRVLSKLELRQGTLPLDLAANDNVAVIERRRVG